MSKRTCALPPPSPQLPPCSAEEKAMLISLELRTLWPVSCYQRTHSHKQRHWCLWNL